MTSKLPLNEHIYLFFAGRVLTTNISHVNLCHQLFRVMHCQIQASPMFVTLEMDRTKMNAHFRKFTPMGGAYS